MITMYVTMHVMVLSYLIITMYVCQSFVMFNNHNTCMSELCQCMHVKAFSCLINVHISKKNLLLICHNSVVYCTIHKTIWHSGLFLASAFHCYDNYLTNCLNALLCSVTGGICMLGISFRRQFDVALCRRPETRCG